MCLILVAKSIPVEIFNINIQYNEKSYDRIRSTNILTNAQGIITINFNQQTLNLKFNSDQNQLSEQEV